MRLALLFLVAFSFSAFAKSPEILGFGELPADTRDQFGDTVGGIGSAIAYDATEDLYYMTSDRGPGDGTLAYTPRIAVLRIDQKGDQLLPALVKTIPLRDAQGREMTGLIPDAPGAKAPLMKDGRTSIDPEAIALAEDGTIYLSDEYGPYIYQFARNGKMLRRLAFPAAFSPRTASGELDFTAKAKLVSGRNINQGAEGMGIVPGGKMIAAIFQSGLVQDGGHDSPTTRLVLLDIATGKPLASYAYPFAGHVPATGKPLKPSDLSVNDLIALSDKKFLVLERDGPRPRRRAKEQTPAAQVRLVRRRRKRHEPPRRRRKQSHADGKVAPLQPSRPAARPVRPGREMGRYHPGSPTEEANRHDHDVRRQRLPHAPSSTSTETIPSPASRIRCHAVLQDPREAAEGRVAKIGRPTIGAIV